MPTVNMHQAKTNLSKLVQAVETGAEQEVVISRNGKPVARLVPIEKAELGQRPIGFADADFERNDWVYPLGDQENALDAIIEARWDRFERHSMELEGNKARTRKKTA